MKMLMFVLVACLTAFVSPAHAAIILSSSGTNANAGADLSLQLNQASSFYVWVSTNPGQQINGLSLSILSSNPSVLNATSHTVSNPGGRWFSVNPGTLGDLVTNSNAVQLTSGLTTTGQSDFTLHSEIQFVATGLGSTNVTIQPGSGNIAALGQGNIGPSISFGGGSVNVSAVPEPGSIALISLVGTTLAIRRWRTRKQSLATS